MERLSTRILFFSSFLIATSVGDFSTGANQAIRCMLLQNTVSDCSTVPKVAIPIYLVKAYNKSPSLHEALRTKQLPQLTSDQVASLPRALLYLIPRSRLTDLKGAQMAAVLQNNFDDTSIAHQFTAGVQNNNQLLELILKLKRTDLHQDVLQILGETINLQDLNNTLSSLPLKEALLAYLRPSVMLDLSKGIGYDVLVHLKGIQAPKLETIHIIAQMAIKTRFPLANINWLVLGLSADDIKNSSIGVGLNFSHFKLELTLSQARAVFEQIYQNAILTKSELIDCLPVLHKLTPLMLQKFPAQEYNYNSLLQLPLPQSLATACQIQEYIIADCQFTGKLPKENHEWKFRIRYLGKWVSTLPLVVLEEYLKEPLSTAQLLQIESPSISQLQAYYLTGGGSYFDLSAPNNVKVHSVFLNAMPASQFFAHFIGSISSNVLKYLAARLPADNLPRNIAFMKSMNISQSFTLEDLLDNSDVNIFMTLISPKDFKAVIPRLIDWCKDTENKYQCSHAIPELPQQVLAALLEQERNDNNWGWQNLLDKSHVSHLFLGGLTCFHIDQMETGLFIPIMAEYNRHRKQAFPRNLQICSLQKMIAYLKFKMAITQANPSLGLISLLEPIEIESVGGYVLVGLPVEALKVSPYLEHILTTIGKLSNAELILAANMTQLQSIAQLAVNKDGIADAYVARNLVWFLPKNSTIKNFKLMLQTDLLDKTVCLPQELRQLLAIQLTAQFGPPSMWSMGVLATLQDLLIVFSDEELSSVDRNVWTDAADILVSRYADNVQWIKPTPFHQACASFLEQPEESEYKASVRRLVRWRLRAAQWLLDTVKPPPHAFSSKPTVAIKTLEYNEVDEKVTIAVFNPTLGEGSTSTSESYDYDETTTSTTENGDMTSSSVDTTATSTTTVVSSTKEEVVTNSETTTKETTTYSVELTTVKTISDEEHTQSPKQVKIENGTKYSLPNQNYIDNSKEDIEEEHSSNYNPQAVVNRLNDSTNTKEQNNSMANKLSTLPLVATTLTPINTTLPPSQTSTVEMIKNVSKMDSLNTNSNVSNIKNDSDNEAKIVSNSHLKNISQSSIIPNSENESNKLPDLSQEMSINKTTSDATSDDIEEDTTKDENNTILDQKSSENIVSRRRRSVVTSDSVLQLSCNALRMVGPLSGFALTEMDLEAMSDSEIKECRVELGKMDLSLQLLKDLWKRIGEKKHIGTHLLGSLLQAITVGDLWDMESWDISQPWVLETIHAFVINVNNTTVLKKILENIRNKNSEFSSELVAVLGGSICLLDWDMLNTLQLPIVSFQSDHCLPCLPFLAKKAIEELGPVSQWTQHYVHSLNTIVAGLEIEDWKVLAESSLKPLSALQPSAIACLNNSHLEILTTDHFKLIPTLTLHALLRQQIVALNASQIEALRNSTQVLVEGTLMPNKEVYEEETPASGSCSLASCLLIFINMIYLVYISL